MLKCDSPDIHSDDALVKKIFLPVAVTLNGKDKSESKGAIQFGFYQFHTLESLKPDRGPITGDTMVKIYGEHFA